MTNRAPAATFFVSFRYCGMTSRSCRLWFVTTHPRKKSVRPSAPSGFRSSCRPAFISANMPMSPTESMSKTGAACPLWPVTG